MFSKEFVEELKIKPNPPKVLPKYEAEIQLLVEIEENIDKLEFEYDKNLFEINKTILNDKTKTTLKKGDTIKITCLKDLDSDKEIKIYAYPKIEYPEPELLLGSESQDSEQPILCKLESFMNRKLAGKIIVLQNDSKVRKEEKFVFVSIWTNINNNTSPDKGNFQKGDEKQNFYNSLYQSFVIPIVAPDEEILDLSNHNDFKITVDSTGKQVYGTFVDASNKLKINWVTHKGGVVTNNFIQNMQTLFFNDKEGTFN